MKMLDRIAQERPAAIAAVVRRLTDEFLEVVTFAAISASDQRAHARRAECDLSRSE